MTKEVKYTDKELRTLSGTKVTVTAVVTLVLVSDPAPLRSLLALLQRKEHRGWGLSDSDSNPSSALFQFYGLGLLPEPPLPLGVWR